jgi:hypothetical protein
MPKKIVTITEQDTIKVGDIVFYIDTRIIENGEGSPYSHVGIVTQIIKDRKHVIPIIAHATSNEKYRKVIESPLPTFASYYVFRYNNKNVNSKAVEIAQECVKQNIPYDEERFKAMQQFLKEYSDSLQKALSENQKKFNSREYLQPWKFLLRYFNNHLFIRQGSERGFRCDQFVILCLQMAELQIQDSNTIVHVAGKKLRPSLSHYNEELTANFFKAHSNQSMKKLSSQLVNRDVGRKALAVPAFFKPEVSLKTLKELFFQLDPKVCSPSVLFYFIINKMFDGGGGVVDIPTPGFEKIGVIIPNNNHTKYFPNETEINSTTAVFEILASYKISLPPTEGGLKQQQEDILMQTALQALQRNTRNQVRTEKKGKKRSLTSTSKEKKNKPVIKKVRLRRF